MRSTCDRRTLPWLQGFRYIRSTRWARACGGRMRIEDLRVFAVLAETRSLHRAAQKTGLTQSAVTKILQRLEAEFEIQLVDRSGRGIELTSAGRVLLERVADVRESV